MIKVFSILFAFLLWTAPALDISLMGNADRMNYAQRQEPDPICKKDLITIPIKRVGRLLIIEAQVDSIKGNFILDTGAPYTVLNKTYFRKYKKQRGYVSSGVTGSGNEVYVAEVGKLNIKDVEYRNLLADVADLSHIENARGIKILGLLGCNLLSSFEFEIDIRAGVLKLFRCRTDGHPFVVNNEIADFAHPVSYYNNTIFMKCKIAEKDLLFGFDTGAESNVLSSFSGKKILSTISISGRRNLMGTGSEQVEILIGRMNNFFVGDISLLGMQTIITQLEDMSNGYGQSIDGMLGYDFLAKGKVRVNLKKGEMRMVLFDKFNNGE